CGLHSCRDYGCARGDRVFVFPEKKARLRSRENPEQAPAKGTNISFFAEALFISGLFQNFSGRKKAATILRSPPSPFIAVDNRKLFLHCVVQFFVSVHNVLMRFLDFIELLLLISRERLSNLG